MITALDSSIILDVLTGSSRYADASEQLLRRSSAEGRLILGECVAAEIMPAFSTKDDFSRFLHDWQIDFVLSSLESSALASEYFAKHLQRGGKARRVLPDFLIAAHAFLNADRLLARDRGYFRDYFAQLKVIGPETGR
jgi:predicted nucleic acid-binding protein